MNIVGPGAKLVRYEGVQRFDVLPLLVATDGAVAAFGHDHRPLRPNLLIGGVEGLAEREWPGCCLRIGHLLIGVQDLPLRCIMTSYHPDTLIQDKDVTRDIYRRFDGKLALNCFVIEGGDITIGDEVQLMRGRACSASAATSPSRLSGLVASITQPYSASGREIPRIIANGTIRVSAMATCRIVAYGFSSRGRKSMKTLNIGGGPDYEKQIVGSDPVPKLRRLKQSSFGLHGL